MTEEGDAFDAPAGPDWAGMVRVRCGEMRGMDEALVRVELGACAAQLVARHGLIRVAEDLERLAAIYRARAASDERRAH